MSNRQNTFGPSWGNAVINTTSTSSSSDAVGLHARVICVTNQDGTDGVYVRSGDSAVAATTADYYLPPNGSVTLTKDPQDTHVACIAVANTPAVHIIPGQGI
jgi:hypothetical protein